MLALRYQCRHPRTVSSIYQVKLFQAMFLLAFHGFLRIGEIAVDGRSPDNFYFGFDTARYKSHSFRIGAASESARQGYSDNQIRQMGRWKSDQELIIL
ncbi:PREDICTED: uncharacterized protein LOC106808433 [Priapulus caudatus]|uniref:Uncharacterized protein LOC106808433 n=1 Tax=Priapulus caudatus TaxID=37621 RepID=A0ABM1E374_PRICU|nr:PREDICTED: uncharacterized protein LOC106808433 [Priapulus caudatus]